LLVEIERQRFHPRLVEEPDDRGDGVAAGRDRGHGEPLAAELAVERVEGRQFLAAGGAPGGPEVDRHISAPELREPPFVAAVVVEGGIRRGHGFLVNDELQHGAFAQRLELGLPRRGGVCTEREARVEDGGEKQTHEASGGATMTDRTQNAMWGGRFAAGPDAIMEAINASIGFDRRLYAQDIAGSRAHAAMLAATGILSDSDAAAIREGLLTLLSEIEAGKLEFSTALEDIHMNVEARLKEIIGEPAGRLHTARSRNDQVATDFRLWVRDQADAAIIGLTALQRALIVQAEAGADWVMPGFTHLQTAQPVTWGHHVMAYVEMFGRDIGRFADARARMNECPLGAAALAGTSFPIDRQMTAEALGFDLPLATSLGAAALAGSPAPADRRTPAGLLGFDLPMAHSHDAVSDRHFALDFLAASAICAVHLSRFAEELVIWSSAQFRFVTLSDRFSTGS